MNIINIRGTNGAGKSTLVRRIMELYDRRTPLIWESRRKPAGYHCYKDEAPPLFVPGHYEIQNGGIDTFRSLDLAYSLVKSHSKMNNVIFEGKNMSDGTTRMGELGPKSDVYVVAIQLPLEECIAAVRERGHTIKESTIERLWIKTGREMKAFRALGYDTATLPREEAYGLCRSLLEV